MQYHISASALGYRLPEGTSLFESINFSFSGVRTGLVGANGIGKSTLLEIFAGSLAPSSGSISCYGRISYLKQNVTFDSRTTVAGAIGLFEEIAAYERMVRGEGALEDIDLIGDRWDLLERIESVFAKLGVSHISLDRPVISLSGGELTRVRIAGLQLGEPDFLLLDEPTNHLDLNAREYIYDLIATWGRGLIVVSHDQRLLSLVDQIVEMNANGLKSYGGNYEFYREQREIERSAAEQSLSGAQQRLKEARLVAQSVRERQQRRQSAAARNSFKRNLPPIVAGGWKRAAERSSAGLKERHEQKIEDARQEVIAARDNLPLEHQITIDLERSRVPAQKRMIELVDVNYRYPGESRELWSTPLNLEIVGPERVWLKGSNGSGKSTLIDLICGRKRPTKGTVKVGTERVGLLDQQVSVLDDSLTVLENLKRVAPLRPEHWLRTLLGRFLFIRDSVFKRASVLSGGERMRAGLACLLGADQSPEILIADEPTNNLDLPSIEELASALKNFRGTLIVVSHETSFLEEIGIGRVIEVVSSG